MWRHVIANLWLRTHCKKKKSMMPPALRVTRAGGKSAKKGGNWIYFLCNKVQPYVSFFINAVFTASNFWGPIWGPQISLSSRLKVVKLFEWSQRQHLVPYYPNNYIYMGAQWHAVANTLHHIWVNCPRDPGSNGVISQPCLFLCPNHFLSATVL